MTGGEGRPSGDHPGECHAISNSRLLACCHGTGSGCNEPGCNGRREWKGPWFGRERRRVAPAAGAKFIGSVAPITLISHRFECQTRRFFAILRDGPVRYGEEHGLGESTVQ